MKFFINEIKFTFTKDRDLPIEVAYSHNEGIWLSTLNNNIRCFLGNVIEMEIPLDDIDLQPNEIADFIVIDGTLGKGTGTYPRDMFLTIHRAGKSQLVHK